MLTASLEKAVGDGGTVTEEVLVASIKEVTPKPFLPLGMKQIKPMLSKEY